MKRREETLFAKSFEEFKDNLTQHEISTTTKYVQTYGRKIFSAEKLELTADLRLHWQDDVPYFHFGTRTYLCHQGKDTNVHKKKKYAQKMDEKANSDHVFIKRYNKATGTKKVNCPASVYVTRVFRMPEYKLPIQPTKNEKDQMSITIKQKIKAGEELCGEEGYMYSLPSVEDHKNHVLGNVAATTEPLDRRVRDYILHLVQEGKTSPQQVSRLLYKYVETELQETNKDRRRFYPDTDTIRRIMARTKNNAHVSMTYADKIDQGNAEIMMSKWKPDSCNAFFRPSTVDNVEAVETCDEDEENENLILALENALVQSTHLLFVYQSIEMRNLYQRYAENAVFLDAIYRTCKCAIPLYFLVVKTNVNFEIVGVIITQFETKTALIEALVILRDWNATITPKYAIADFVAKEISSLEAVFPGTQVFISSFHREQQWIRWAAKTKYSKHHRKKALTLLRNVANATTENEMLNALVKLKSWELYKTTQLQDYFEEIWQMDIKKWAFAYQPNDMYFNTNNGVERINEELNYRDLQVFENCSFSVIVSVLVNEFLVKRYKSYVQENMSISPNCCREYDENIPEYLHCRPKWLVSHIIYIMSTISEMEILEIVVLSSRKFLVPSNEKKGFGHTVEFNKSTCLCRCTCPDYRKTRLICKHIVFVGLKFPKWSLDNIFSWLFSNPIYRFDETVSLLDELESVQIVEELEIEQVVDIEEHQNSVVCLLEHNNTLSTSGNFGQNEVPSDRHHVINECKATIRSIQSVLPQLNYKSLCEISETLRKTFDEFSKADMI